MHKSETASHKLPPKPLRVDSEFSAAYLGVKERTLKQYRIDRKLPFYRVSPRNIVFDIRDLDAFLARKRVEAIEGGGK